LVWHEVMEIFRELLKDSLVVPKKAAEREIEVNNLLELPFILPKSSLDAC